METIAHNFLGIDPKYADYAKARFAVLPVLYDSASSYGSGARHGAPAIISASHHVEWFDEELERECHKIGIATLDAVQPNLDGPKAMEGDLYRMARRLVRDGKFPFGLGGDHSVSAGLIRGVMSKHKKLSILQIDAHLDLRNEFLGSRYAHACVMRRSHELGANIVPVGIRAVDAAEHRYCRAHGIEPITARDCAMEEDWLDRAINALGDTVYITIDIDAFDPAYAPGTGTPEPGGLDWYQVIGLLRLVAAEKNVVGADIVEVMPLPGQVVTEFLAARLAYKLMCYVADGR